MSAWKNSLLVVRDPWSGQDLQGRGESEFSLTLYQFYLGYGDQR